MKKTENDVFVPPYISVGEFSKFVSLIGKRGFDPLTLRDLSVNGFTNSNSYTLLGSLKTMGLYGSDGRILERQDLIDLGSKDEAIKRDAIKRIFDRTYSELIAKIPVEDSTIEKIQHYFETKGAAKSISIKAARMFLWLAHESGYTISQEFKPYKVDKKPDGGQKTKSSISPVSKQSASKEKTINVLTTAEDYEDKLLNILLKKIDTSDGLPDAEILKQVRELIDTKKEKSKSHHVNSPEPSEQKESEKA